ncbi:MAG: ComEC/Rec2 family competence protein [Minisyncoccia bacterium]
MNNLFLKTISRFFWKIICLLIFLNIFNWLLVFSFYRQPFFEINFLNVGQGDSELLKTKAGNVLIDAGPDKKVLEQINQFLPFFEKTIDIVIISHPNIDHYRGLFEVLKSYKIRAVILNNIDYSSKEYQSLLKDLLNRNILLVKGIKGIKINLGDQSIEQKITILSPETLNSKDLNQDSIICYYKNPLVSALFLGDTNKTIEEKITKYLEDKNSLYRILKVAHHGSKNATSEEILSTFQPNFAIIEVGKNNYSHPHISTLEKLEKFQVETFRTDLDGSIQFSVDKNFQFFYRLLKK